MCIYLCGTFETLLNILVCIPWDFLCRLSCHLFFLLTCTLSISFSYLIMMATTSNTVLHKSDESRHSCFISDHWGEAVHLPPLSITSSVRFFVDALYQLRNFLLLMWETSKHVENSYEFIWAKLRTIARKQNLNGLGKCSREWQLYSLFYTLESKEET